MLNVPPYAVRGTVAGAVAFFAGLAFATAAVVVFGLALLVAYREYAAVAIAALPGALALAPNVGVLGMGASTGAYDSTSGLPTPSWPIAVAMLVLTIVLPGIFTGLRLRAKQAPFVAVLSHPARWQFSSPA